jgi:hypothetical protein
MPQRGPVDRLQLLQHPSCLVCRTRAVWQYRPVPPCQGCSHPAWRLPRQGCPQFQPGGGSLAAVTATVSGRPLPSQTRWRLDPGLPRSTGFAPAWSPPLARTLMVSTLAIAHTIPERSDQQAAPTRRGSRGGRPPVVDPVRYRQRNMVEPSLGLAAPGHRHPLRQVGGQLPQLAGPGRSPAVAPHVNRQTGLVGIDRVPPGLEMVAEAALEQGEVGPV